MLIANDGEHFAEYYWYIIFLLGFLILAWYIRKDYKARKSNWTDTIFEGHLSPNITMHTDTDDGILLVDPYFQLIGGNTNFYSYTGLAEMKPFCENIQFLKTIFPEHSRTKATKQLEQLLYQGYGTMESVIIDNQARERSVTISIYHIRDGEETIAYYVTVKCLNECSVVQTYQEITVH